MLLPDINFWLALTFDIHVHHAIARAWFESTAELCSFCRLSQQGFLRLATNRKVLGDEAVSLVEAWRLYDRILSEPRIVFSEEPADLEVHWRSFTQSTAYAPNLWSDAYLAAFAKSRGYQVVTFDSDFDQFLGITRTILKY